MISLLCAIAMMLLLATPAFAIGPVSAYAGSTISVQVSVINASDEVTTTLIQVPVPATATEAQVGALALSAASQTKLVGGISSVPTSRGFDRADDVSTQGLTLINSSKYTYVGGGTLAKDYKTLIVEITEVATASASKILMRVNTSNNPTVDYDKTADIPYSGAEVYIVYICGTGPSGDNLSMNIDDKISVYAKLDTGGANFNTINVYADPYAWV